ncbi:phosphofurin acidic cluster sorting protein 2-like [Sycon ciliatum]|uniref:phosphofurin acidic cluster sorting protein 2-like n=1 Tax=Sycon ciliatum TaxID=27933 RepID=UPI0031F63A8A
MAQQGASPAVMPMKLIASWDLERTTSATCVPRLCTLTLTNLEALRVLEPGLQRITIGVALKGSRHTLRSNDIEVPSNETFSMNLQITFALQYPHFIKRDVNVLRVMLQRRKRYKTKPIPGYRTLAVGQVNLSEVIQHDLGSELFLYAPKNKDGEAEHVSTVSLGVLTSHAIDATRQSHGLLNHEVDSSEEDQEFFEASDEDDPQPMQGLYDEGLAPQQQHRHTQRLQALHLLKGMAKKRLNRGKFFQFPRRGKLSGVEGEVDPEEEHEGMEGMELEEAFGGSDFMPSDDNDMDLSDSDFDLDPETMSVRSTPKPVLRPFYAPSTTSSSSASIRGHANVGDNQRHSAQHPPVAPTSNLASHGVRTLKQRVEQVKEKAEKTLKKEPKETRSEERDRTQAREGRSERDHGRRPEDRPTRRSNSGEDAHRISRRDDERQPTRKSNSFGETVTMGLVPFGERVAMSSSGTQICVSGDNQIPPGYPLSVPQDYSSPQEPTTPTKQSVLRQRSFSAIQTRRANISTLTGTPQRMSAAEISSMCRHNVVPDIDPDVVTQLNDGTAADRAASLLADMPPSIILLNACDPHGVSVGRALADAKMPVVCTQSGEQVQGVMAAIFSKLLKYCSSHTGDPSLGVCIVGSEGYTNAVLQAFVKLITTKSSIKLSFFRFFIVPLGVNRLASYIASTDGLYWSLFHDSLWKEAFDSHDGTWEHLSSDLFTRLNRYLGIASSTRQFPIAQALVNRAKVPSEGDSGQVFVYFLNEVRMGSLESNDLVSSDDLAASLNSEKTTPGTPAAATVVANQLATGDGEAVKLNQSPPQGSSTHKDVANNGPPSTPLVASAAASGRDGISAGGSSSGNATGSDALDLTLDYRPVNTAQPNSASSTGGKKDKESGKLTAKTTVRCAWITILPTNYQGQHSPPSAFTMVLVPKEKSKRALPFPLPRRSHGRDKEKDAIENAYLSTLVCSSTKRSTFLKVYIDTVEWTDVKFFSLSPPSRTLFFPVATFSESSGTVGGTGVGTERGGERGGERGSERGAERGSERGAGGSTVPDLHLPLNAADCDPGMCTTSDV